MVELNKGHPILWNTILENRNDWLKNERSVSVKLKGSFDKIICYVILENCFRSENLYKSVFINWVIHDEAIYNRCSNGVLNYVVKWVDNSAAVDLDVGWAGHHTEECVHESFVSLLRAVVELFVLSIHLFYVFLRDENVVFNQALDAAAEVTATATATVNSAGDVSLIAITNPGAGYTAVPTVNIADISQASVPYQQIEFDDNWGVITTIEDI